MANVERVDSFDDLLVDGVVNLFSGEMGDDRRPVIRLFKVFKRLYRCRAEDKYGK